MEREGSAQEDDEAGSEVFGELAHTHDVYSFFKFVVPLKTVELERDGAARKFRNAHTHVVMAYGLVILAVFMQAVVLYAIFWEVVVKAISWQNGIVKVDNEPWSLFAAESECTDGSSICTYVNGTYTCAPPSVQLTSRWSELDLNNDGIWSHEEAVEARDAITCKYGVDPTEVFRFFVKILHARKEFIWLHPDVVATPSGVIHKAYFQYLTGDVSMCLYRTVDMCPNLLRRGFFDSALALGTAPRVGNTTSTALEYCRSLLEPGGICEQTLPSTYWVWKTESIEQCQAVEYNRFDYKHPKTGYITSLLSADYEAHETYAKFQSPLFITYKAIIVFSWFLTMLPEVKYILKGLGWISGFPVGARHEMDDDMKQITSVKRRHYNAIAVLLCIRAVMCVLLIWVGLQFLMRSKTYVGQLFDAVAMIFVLQFAQLLYDNGINARLQEEVDALQPMTYQRKSVLAKGDRGSDLFWLTALLLSTVAIMARNHYSVVVPVYQALGCACLQSGQHCHEATAFGKEFWQNYWGSVVPGVLQDIDGLRAGKVPKQVNFEYHIIQPPQHRDSRARRPHVRHRRHHEEYTEFVKRLHR